MVDDGEEPLSEQQSIRFLLGELSEEERLAFEERLLVDGELFERVRAEERELLDAWARGELSPAEARRLETHYLASPAGRDKLGFARALQTLEARERRAQQRSARILRFPRRPIERLALAAGLAAAVIGLGWLLRLAAPGPGPAPVVASVQLSAISVRGADGPQIVEVPAAAERVELVVDLEGVLAEGPFDVEVRDDEGTVIRRVVRVAAVEVEWGRTLSVELAAEILPGGEYELRLRPSSGEVVAVRFALRRR